VKPMTTSTFWSLFGLLLWLVMIQPILNPPWAEEIDTLHDETHFSFAPNLLSDTEFTNDLANNLTVIEFDVQLIKSSIFLRLWWSVLTVLGVYSSWLIYRDSKYWPFLVLVVTGLSCLRTIPITFQLINFFPAVSDHFSYVWRLFVRETTEGFNLTSFMNSIRVFVWPYLCSILLLYSGFSLVKKIMNSNLSPNNRMQPDPAKLGR
jgi:hypothetical protein